MLLAVTPVGVAGGSGTFTIGSPVTASGASAYVGCAVGSTPGGVNYPNTAVEPFVAVNPTNPQNIIGNFQQDRWSDGGAKALTLAYSTNGGSTWTRNNSPFSECSGGDPNYDRTTDPWVSFDSAGRAYQIALSIDSAELGLSGVLANTSTNGGATWSTPVEIIRDDNPIEFNDKESITGDWRPTVGAGKAYATWIRGDLPGWDSVSPVGQAHSFAYRGLPMFSKTTDGGATWSTPISMTNSNIYVQGNQIAVLPDGTLVDIGATLFKGSGVQPTPQAFFWTAIRSKNGGKTWTSPVRIAPLGTALLTDPDNLAPTTLDETVRAGDYLPDVAVDKSTGDLYMVFADSIGDGWNHVKLTKSTDGGKKWSTPVDVTETPDDTHSFNGTVEVTDDGIVAVMYYDFRSNDPSEADTLETDVWLAHSHDGGATFDAGHQHVYGPFDMKHAPVARGWFLGDYMGMDAIADPSGPDDLMLFFAVSTSADDSAGVVAIRADR
jgi:hypothetical protein